MHRPADEPRIKSLRVASRGLLTVAVAVVSSVFLLFIVAPMAGLVSQGGARGIAAVASDGELRASLLLTAVTATIATVLGIVGATPIAYLLARRQFRGRGLVAALMDLPLVSTEAGYT